jgi:hypothetical protein
MSMNAMPMAAAFVHGMAARLAVTEFSGAQGMAGESLSG